MGETGFIFCHEVAKADDRGAIDFFPVFVRHNVRVKRRTSEASA
jgi:hypothetical protein